MLLKLADALDEHGDEIAELESLNVGKPLSSARDEIPVATDNIRFFAGAARVLEGKSAGEYMRGYTSWLRREPIGIVGGIAPWNYPLMMAIWKLAPALAAGNVQVLKPSEQTPLTTLRFAQLAAEILPPGVLNVITGDGVPAGEAIVKHPDVRLVSLTGDVETGKIIARTAADNLKRVHLELGGKAPVIVFDDADPAAVAEGIKIGGYWNSGTGLHGSFTCRRGPEDLRPAARGARPGRRVAARRRSCRGRRDRDGPGDLEGPAGTRARLHRPREGRDRPDGRRHERRPRLLRQADGGRRRRPDRRDRADARSSARSSRCSASPTTTRRSRGRTT